MTAPITVSRVRAIALTRDDQLLLIHRIRPGRPDYWVLPGGGIEPTDMTLTTALARELREETGGHATIYRLIHLINDAPSGQAVFLARVDNPNPHTRTGPELTTAGTDAGEYHLEAHPLTPTGLTNLDIRPHGIADLLAEHLRAGRNLFDLPTCAAPTISPAHRKHHPLNTWHRAMWRPGRVRQRYGSSCGRYCALATASSWSGRPTRT
ncbi:hypothetical protein GCM10009682_24060 [Luedemannella flava]|uniref:Nudix hydrolase domain-containing protein n=1 Tax=Luedemannella flava TaxID=349316 RepID=A0ABN2LWR3_9ACTN